jgi:hypothetical protein
VLPEPMWRRLLKRRQIMERETLIRQVGSSNGHAGKANE